MAAVERDVVVVGAGISGLSAARLLGQNGVNVQVLEARDRVGGRTYTKKDPDYGIVDMGGAYVGPTQDRILHLAQELGVKTYPTHREGSYLFYSKGKVMRYSGSWPYWNPLCWLDCNHLFRKIDRLLQQIPLDTPWTAPEAMAWDRMTMQQFLDKNCWTRAAMEWGTNFVQCNVTAEPCEVSMLWFLWYVKSAGGVSRMWEVDQAAQDMKFMGGSQQISIKMAEKLGDKVSLDTAVQSIAQQENTVMVTTKNGSLYKAKYVILAMAPTIQMKIQFEPPLPSHKYQLMQRLPMGACIKCQIWYKQSFWRQKGLNGISSCADGLTILGNTMDDCQPDGSCPALTGFILADWARIKFTKEERKRWTCECIARIYKSSEALHPLHYEETNWMEEPYTGGCYTAIYPPGVMTRYGRYIRDPVGRLYFAGTETATKWCGYMDGAVQSGERAAREVLHEMGNLDANHIWTELAPYNDQEVEPIKLSRIESYAPSVGELLLFVSATSVLTFSFMYWKLYGRETKLFLKVVWWYYKRQLDKLGYL